MKKLAFLFLTLAMFNSCKQEKTKTATANKETITAEINTLINNWHLAAADANFDDYFSKMDSLSVFIGTDATENWKKEDFAAFSKPYFDKGKAWDFKTLERNVYMNDTGNFVWFDELLNTWMGTCRGSGVLEKKDQNWVIKHYVLSVEIPNEDIQKVIEVKREKDSLFLAKFKK